MKTDAMKNRFVIILAIAGSLPFAAAAILVIAWWMFMVSTRNNANQKAPEKQITLDLDRPDGLKDYIQEWIPESAVNKDKLSGVIEDEPATMTLCRNSVVCSLEPALITVDIDIAKGGKVERIFISSEGMALHDAVSSMKTILAMLDANPEKLKKWTQGALTWSRDPKSWPRDALSPMDAWYSEIVRTTDIECELEIRRSGDEAKPWRIIIRTGPRMFNLTRPGGEPPPEGSLRTTEE